MSNVAQRSFGAGELAPSLYARTDLARYAVGLATCRNFQVQRGGGAENRAGTEFCEDITIDDSIGRMIPFKFSVEQNYALCFTDETLRVFRDGALITTIASPYDETHLFALRYSQSLDVMTLTHPSYPIYELQRTGDAAWAFVLVDTSPSIAPPENLISTGGETGTARTYFYRVTAVKETTGEESLQSDHIFGGGAGGITPTEDMPILVQWDAVAGAGSYNVYRLLAAGVGDADFTFVGSTRQTAFADTGIIDDPTRIPPIERNPFDVADDYPAVVGIFQQRRIFANTNNNPETCYASRIGDYANFRLSSPIKSDDPITWAMAGRTLNRVKHILDLGVLVVFTETAEFIMQGDEAGTLLPTAVNPKWLSGNGASALPPVEVNDSALYVQARGSIVRDLFADAGDGSKGRDLTLMSTHLVDGFEIVDWTFQKAPHSIVWMVRDDGKLIGLTYVRDQEMLAWHRHDTQNGYFESVCAIPEGDQDRIYAIVRRTINGQTVRYVERFASRILGRDDAGEIDPETAWFVDSGLEYDGRDAGVGSGKTMTLSGGSSWTSGETLTLTASASQFVVGDVGNGIFLHGLDADGDAAVIRFTISGYTSPTVVTGHAHMTVPVPMRSVAITEWDDAVDTITGLDHLEGETVAVYADTFVLGSPNNEVYTVYTVSGGELTLDRPYAHIVVGLPITSDFETLDLDTPSGSSIKNRKLRVSRVTLKLESSRGLFVGEDAPTADEDPLQDLYELKLRDDEVYNDPVSLLTGDADVEIESSWNSKGAVFCRQVDPLPVTILSAIPQGNIPLAA